MASASSSSIQSKNEIPKIKELRPDGEWLLPPGSESRIIQSIHIDEENDYVFLADCANDSIIEFNKRGEMLTEFRFDAQNNEDLLSFKPYDMCLLSPDILAVCGGMIASEIVFLQIKTSPPFLELKKIITDEGRTFTSLCLKNESIFCFDSDCKLHSFSKEGEQLEIIEIGGLRRSFGLISRIRVDPVSGKFWMSGSNPSKIASFHLEEKRLEFVDKGGKEFFDFSFSKFGQLYFPTREGIFSCFPEIKLTYEFPEKYVFAPTISISEDKVIVCIQNEGTVVIKVFNKIY